MESHLEQKLIRSEQKRTGFVNRAINNNTGLVASTAVKMSAGILHMTTSTEARCCMAYGQPLLPKSKMTVAAISQEEADRCDWTGRKNAEGTVTVDLCRSCQITRTSPTAKNAAPTSF